jgi:hypothetical protein
LNLQALFESFSSAVKMFLKNQLHSLESGVESVSSALPRLADACEFFTAKSAEWTQKRKLNRLMMEVHFLFQLRSVLVVLSERYDIVDIHWTCSEPNATAGVAGAAAADGHMRASAAVRGGTESRSVRSLVAGAPRRYSHSLSPGTITHPLQFSTCLVICILHPSVLSPVSAFIFLVQMHEMEQSSRALIVQLISSLQGALQLPTGLRVLGYLRRMGVFTEQVWLCDSPLVWCGVVCCDCVND